MFTNRVLDSCFDGYIKTLTHAFKNIASLELVEIIIVRCWW